MRLIDMPRVFFAVILLFVLIFPGAVFSVASAGEVIHSIKVRGIRFAGVEAVSKKELAEALFVSVPPFWKFWEPHPVVHEKDLADDVLRIQQYYRSQGFYETAVAYALLPVDPETADADNAPRAGADAGGTTSSETEAGERDVPTPEYIIEFHVTEGPPVIVRDVAVECLCTLETMTADRIREAISLAPGQIFKTAEYETAKTVIKKRLGNKAYPFADVQANALVDLTDHSAVITFHIEPGELYYFGDIHISGHDGYVREKTIRRAITFTPGEKYNAAELDASRRNLFDLNVFKTAVVQPGEPDSAANRLPVNVQVAPREKRSVRLGVGYGTDDGLRLQAAWSYRNLTRRADRLTFRARRSDILENIYGEYLVPYFLAPENSLIATGGFKREEKDYYTLRRTSAEVNLHRKLDAVWFSTMGYNLEINRPEDVRVEDVRVEDVNGLIDPRDTEDYLVSSVKFSIERNTVDNVLNSTKGTSVRFTMENASNYLGSEIDYFRPGIDVRAFVPLPWGMVLAGRLDFRTIREIGDTDYIPISKQFFMGGSKSVRGYGFEKLGVVDENDVIQSVSGVSSFLGNLELRFPFYKDFGGVVFLDAGALNNDDFEVDLNSLRYTSGLGLRYNTIIGPVQLDFGYQLNPAKSTATDDPLLMDLLEKDRWYIHFNIGQSF